MARRSRKSITEKAGEFELNLTPMIDAVFLLLIFFMTTTVFVKATQLQIELPDAEHYDKLTAEKKLNLRISREGSLEINGQIVAMGQLAGWLKREKMSTGSTTLIITADGGTAHGFIIDAMEMATMAGVEKIDVETQEPVNQQSQ
ncbi:MAG: biopolymer transporter ExbD [Candidatus Latescibacteria bacterium]|nr:biopolymer transporter ExbD [Candidatus Latescibacterota bacterium]